MRDEGGNLMFCKQHAFLDMRRESTSNPSTLQSSRAPQAVGVGDAELPWCLHVFFFCV